MRITGRLALLVTLWLLAWGQITLANVMSGTVVATALLVAFPLRSRRGGLRPSAAGIGRLGVYVVTQLVISNILMTRQILSRRIDVKPGVLAHRLQQPSEEVVTLMTSIIALSPGTMTVDVDRASSVIYVHFFPLRDLAAARATLDRLERLAAGALGAPHRQDRSPFQEPS